MFCAMGSFPIGTSRRRKLNASTASKALFTGYDNKGA